VEPGAPVTITLDAFPGQELTGKVALINPMGETVQGNVKYNVRIDLDPVENPLLLGATANVIIQTGLPSEVALVPVRAIQTDDAGEFVQVVQPDGTLKRVEVTTGRLVGDQVIVLSDDLEVGQTVTLPVITNEMMQRMSNMGQ
jgi:multidrug efflux pump subunit AcrA (membrane-fusion protein)